MVNLESERSIQSQNGQPRVRMVNLESEWSIFQAMIKSAASAASPGGRASGRLDRDRPPRLDHDILLLVPVFGAPATNKS